MKMRQHTSTRYLAEAENHGFPMHIAHFMFAFASNLNFLTETTAPSVLFDCSSPNSVEWDRGLFFQRRFTRKSHTRILHIHFDPNFSEGLPTE